MAMGSETFVGYYLEALVAALAVLLLIWGACELVTWSAGRLSHLGRRALEEAADGHSFDRAPSEEPEEETSIRRAA